MEKQATNQYHSKEERRTVIELWRESGKSKKSFCEEFGIKYHTFIGWTNLPKKRRPEHAEEKKAARVLASSKPAFVPVRVKESKPEIFAALSFQNGSSLILHQAVSSDYIREILR